MANNSYTQQALANSHNFRLRVKNALSKIAWEVLNENVQTTDHDKRAAFALKVINNLDNFANTIASWLVVRTNIIAFETSFDFQLQAVVTASGDPDIESQISTDWNILMGF